jgi:phosphoribosyl-ATP pyrophosphohydrolase/phosphoribosyl-AMP cyclohydrolase
MNLNFAKYSDGLIPSIVQDCDTGHVLMLGFMYMKALETTRSTGRVTFYSRKKQRLWTKGETSGNFLEFVAVAEDCDSDTLLVKARPVGPTCHKGADTCFGETNDLSGHLLSDLESIINDRRQNPVDGSYVSKLFAEGINRILQKVGEEAVETVIAAKDDDPENLKNEAADLLFHYLVLLNAKNLRLSDIVEILNSRRR